MHLRVVCVGDAPYEGEGAGRVAELPKTPESKTVYLLPSEGERPKRPFPALIYNPEKAHIHPDRYYSPESLTAAQLLLAWRTYILKKWCKRKWRIRLLEKAPSIYFFAFDDEMRVLDYNPALKMAVRILGGETPYRGQPVLRLILPPNRAAFQEELRLLREGHALQFQRMVGSRYAEVCLLPLHRDPDTGKAVYGYYALDTTLYQRLVDSALAQQALQEQILAHLREGIFVLDAQHRLVYLNPSAERMLGGTAMDWIGKPLPFSPRGPSFFYRGRLFQPTRVSLEERDQILLVLRDLSDLWQAEKLNRLLHAAIQQGPVGIQIFQSRGSDLELFYQNSVAAKWLSSTEKDTQQVLERYLSKRDITKFRKALKDFQSISFLLRRSLKKGGWSHIEGTLFPFQLEEADTVQQYWLCVLQNQTDIHRAIKLRHRMERRQNRLIIEAQEKERKLLAEELHDNVGMLLSVLKMEMSALISDLPASSPWRERLIGIAHRLDEVTQVVRFTSHQLMPPLVEHFGLLPSVEGLIRRLSFLSSLNIHLETRGEEVAMPLVKVIHIYRIIQELVNNTVKHAGAEHLHIKLSYQKNTLIIEVKDDGRGYLPGSLGGEGIGLRNILGRVQLLGARWENLSAPGKGAHYRIEIPLPRKKS